MISANADALEAAFAEEAAALARQILVTATLPDSLVGDEATVTVSAPLGGTTATASTYAVVRSANDGPNLTGGRGNKPAFEISQRMMYGGLAALGLGLTAPAGKPARRWLRRITQLRRGSHPRLWRGRWRRHTAIVAPQ